jgi:hypothetical protein
MAGCGASERKSRQAVEKDRHSERRSLPMQKKKTVKSRRATSRQPADKSRPKRATDRDLTKGAPTRVGEGSANLRQRSSWFLRRTSGTKAK